MEPAGCGNKLFRGGLTDFTNGAPPIYPLIHLLSITHWHLLLIIPVPFKTIANSDAFSMHCH